MSNSCFVFKNQQLEVHGHFNNGDAMRWYKLSHLPLKLLTPRCQLVKNTYLLRHSVMSQEPLPWGKYMYLANFLSVANNFLF